MAIVVKIQQLKAKEIFHRVDGSIKQLLKHFALDYEIDPIKLEGKVSLGSECYGSFKISEGTIEFDFDRLFILSSLEAKVDALWQSQLRPLDS